MRLEDTIRLAPLNFGWENPEIKKPFLLETSPYTKVVMAPTRGECWNMVILNAQKAQYNSANVPAAVLLAQGNLKSVSRIVWLREWASNEINEIQEKSDPNKMIVISVENMIENTLKKKAPKNTTASRLMTPFY